MVDTGVSGLGTDTERGRTPAGEEDEKDEKDLIAPGGEGAGGEGDDAGLAGAGGITLLPGGIGSAGAGTAGIVDGLMIVGGEGVGGGGDIAGFAGTGTGIAGAGTGTAGTACTGMGAGVAGAGSAGAVTPESRPAHLRIDCQGKAPSGFLSKSGSRLAHCAELRGEYLDRIARTSNSETDSAPSCLKRVSSGVPCARVILSTDLIKSFPHCTWGRGFGKLAIQFCKSSKKRLSVWFGFCRARRAKMASASALEMGNPWCSMADTKPSRVTACSMWVS
mmetsp:Transcript_49825/g.118765  ORF Transcript_49825/g.118765 Transcript_49825/m.118765 type:complete len:277 (+) Transcript_49825:75-905(+)